MPNFRDYLYFLFIFTLIIFPQNNVIADYKNLVSPPKSVPNLTFKDTPSIIVNNCLLWDDGCSFCIKNRNNIKCNKLSYYEYCTPVRVRCKQVDVTKFQKFCNRWTDMCNIFENGKAVGEINECYPSRGEIICIEERKLSK